MQNLLDLYSDYLISQNNYATSTGLSDLLEGCISHDKITRFLNFNNFGSEDLWKYVKSDIHKYEEKKGGVLILDDMIEEKPYTDENVAWHYSHTKGRCVKGINILSCLVRYGDKSLPIAYEITHKDLHFSDIKTRKTKRQASIKQNASLNKSPTKVIRSQKNHVFASIVAFCKLEFLKWKTNLNHFALKYKLIITANQKAFQELQKIKESKMVCVT